MSLAHRMRGAYRTILPEIWTAVVSTDEMPPDKYTVTLKSDILSEVKNMFARKKFLLKKSALVDKLLEQLFNRQEQKVAIFIKK